MPLGKEYSLVADSTASSPPHMDTDAFVPLKRILKTYGKHDTQAVEDPESSVSSRNSVHRTAPPGLAEEVPPSSPVFSNLKDTHDNLDAEDELPQEESKFEFSWKKALRRIDDEESYPMYKFDAQRQRSGHLQETADLDIPTSSDAKSVEQQLPSPLSIAIDNFCDPVESQSLSINLSSSPSPCPRSTRKGKTKIFYSDSEQEISKNSSSTTSSQQFSPQRRSSSTQPTSEDDVPVPSKIGTNMHSIGKYKMKPVSSLSLKFTGDLASEPQKLVTRRGEKRKGALSKKEREEAIKESSRITAQSVISIPRNQKGQKYTKISFFAGLSGKGSLPQSDPITAFSSSPELADLANIDEPRPSPSRQRCSTSPAIPTAILYVNESDDEELPEVGQIFQGVNFHELKERKLRALEKKANLEDIDDELEVAKANPTVILKEEEGHRRTAKKGPSEGRKRQLQLAKVKLAKQNVKTVPIISESPAGIFGPRNPAENLNQNELNRLMASQVSKQNREISKEKQQFWLEHGGRLNKIPETLAEGLEGAVKSIAEEGLKVGDANISDNDMIGGDSDRSDEDYSPPNSRPASPVSFEDKEHEVGDEITSPVKIQESIVQPRRTVIMSDSEDDENGEHVVSLDANDKKYRPTASSSELPTEDENDKENNTNLMYDRSEDKENTAIVRHDIFSMLSSSVARNTGPSDLSLSPTRSPQNWGVRSNEMDLSDDEDIPKRRLFKELVSGGISSSLTEVESTSLSQPFTDKPQRGADPEIHLFRDVETSKGFSQFPETQEDILAVPSLQPGFPDLLASFSSKGLTKKARDPLNLTQDITDVINLQPAFQSSKDLIRKADAIFEKEQAFVVEAATNKPLIKQPELYVNEHGFLTQTRSNDSDEEIYQPSLTSFSPSLSVRRQPLRTLPISSPYYDHASPLQGTPLKHLKKCDANVVDLTQFTFNTPLKKPNAFDILGHKVKDSHAKVHSDISGFIDAEAAESDEDDVFGFSRNKNVDDDEDGENLNKSLDALMDDAEMDEETIASDLVREKFMEQAEEEDQDNEKLHIAAIKGELRRKRTRGVGVDDSDDDSDDGANESARRAMKKLRTSDRGDIMELEANDATRPFATAYNQALKDDEDEFSYLNRESQVQDWVLGPSEPGAADNHGENESGADEEDLEQQSISAQVVAQLLRQKKFAKEEDKIIDLSDVSWLDDEDGTHHHVKTVNSRQHLKGRLPLPEFSEADGYLGADFRKLSKDSSENSKQWSILENKSRIAGTSRSVGGSAITGLTKPKTGSTHKLSVATRITSRSKSANKSIKAAPSMLSITNKSRLFD